MIGNGGKKLKRLASENNVIIKKYTSKKQKNMIFKVSGREDNIEKTIWNINRIAETKERKERNRRSGSPSQIVCRFYQTDSCRNEERCRWKHQNARTPKDRSRSPITRRHSNKH